MSLKPNVVEFAPKGDFEKISIEMPEWKKKFRSLIDQRASIKYVLAEMPTLSAEIHDELIKQKYIHLVLASDDWQHFLVPTVEIRGT